jgi:hypothetical protein
MTRAQRMAARAAVAAVVRMAMRAGPETGRTAVYAAANELDRRAAEFQHLAAAPAGVQHAAAPARIHLLAMAPSGGQHPAAAPAGARYPATAPAGIQDMAAGVGEYEHRTAEQLLTEWLRH